MAIGSSGRIVIEVDPELKQELHKLLRQNGTNVKEWFTDHAVDFIDNNKPTSTRKTDTVLRKQKS